MKKNLVEVDALLDAMPVFESMEWLNVEDGGTVDVQMSENEKTKFNFTEAKGDTKSKVGVVTLIKEGFSRNGRVNRKKEFVRRFYSAAGVESIAAWHKKRHRMYSGHITDDDAKRFDRPMESTVSIITDNKDGDKNVWCEKDADGKTVAKAVVRFTEFPIGKSVHAEAVKSPRDVKLSINAKVRANLNQVVDGQAADVIEACGFLYSSDYVSYNGIPGAGVDSTMEAQAGKFTMEAVEACGGEGFYELVESNGYEEEGQIDAFKDEKKAHKKESYTTEAFKSIATRMKEREVRNQYWEVKSAFSSIITEIFKDEKKAYTKEGTKRKAYDEAADQLGDFLFNLDEKALTATLTKWDSLDNLNKAVGDKDISEVIKLIESMSNEKNEGDPNMSEVTFKSVEEAATDEKIVKLVVDKVVVSEMEIKIGEEKFKVSDIVKTIDGFKEKSEREDKYRFLIQACKEHDLDSKQVELLAKQLKIEEGNDSKLTSGQKEVKEWISTFVSEHVDYLKDIVDAALKANDETGKNDGNSSTYIKAAVEAAKKKNSDNNTVKETDEQRRDGFSKKFGW